ncbi:ABC transporter substrate-binding protein [Azospirillum brasilense]|uniref:ABC transporter substrate-binding protein n=1 Tax=Azospirillum brasilense TaxID=192 RepID=UPI000E6842B0|nr:ABC transporter substrate-binding protein [Azospirillum brasilense]NUB27181.1 ABC transporter substrate-binding protein [Azospirillum brasilense]NUB35356.1 ABC transporter substrate-binding protein [Azospirillum brasilense]RIW01141.1 ferrichrome ABC transporter substrate-binding protein [Azospirillum brasilense]
MPGINGTVGRRRVLRTAALLPVGLMAGGAWSAERRTDGGLCALDWTSAQALLALGIVPRGIPELDRYRRAVVEPAVPDGVPDIGARAEPNLELLDRLAPARFVGDGTLSAVQGRLERIAPVTVHPPFDTRSDGDGEPGGQLAFAIASLRGLAAGLGVPEEAERAVARLDRTLAAARDRLSGWEPRPLYILSVLIHGRNSLYHDVLDRLGIANAWTGPSGPYGHATVTMDRLAGRPDAGLVNIGSEGGRALEALAALPLFAGLPFLREGRVTILPPILFYGGVSAAERFARLLGEGLAPHHG